MSQELIERLKLEAQIHAQEARTANATIAEIYQLCSGSKGEPGNWHGAEPVRALVAERDALAATLRQQAARVDAGTLASRIGKDLQNPRFWLDALATAKHTTDCDEKVRVLDNAHHWLSKFVEAALSAQPAQPDAYQAGWDEGYAAGLGDAKKDQPAPERQGAAVAWIDEFGNVYPLGAHSLAGKLSWQDAHKRNWRPLYTHPAAPVGVPDGWISDPDTVPKPIIDACRNAICREFGNNGTDGYYKRILAKVFKAMLAAAPSAPQGTQQGEGE